MSEYIKNINITTYRGIKSLQLSDLAPINILTGDNNCGKTSILEVIESLALPDDFSGWNELIRKSKKAFPANISYYEGFLDLFDVNSKQKSVEYMIETNMDSTTVILEAQELDEELPPEEYLKFTGGAYPGEDEVPDTFLVPRLDLKLIVNGEVKNDESIYAGQRSLYRKGKSSENISNEKVIYISPFRHAEGDFYLSEVFENPELYEEMLHILKEYDVDIISINYDRDSVFRQGFYKILSRTNKKALPLNVYGDGMKKAVLLMSAVVKAKNGILLLDEFETAIHTSAMEKTFRWILETCQKLNVQLFLTSHSKEAIDKVLKCSTELQDKIAVYTLYKEKEGNVTARRLSGRQAIRAQDDMGLELR